MSSRKQKYDEIVDEVLGAGVSTVTKNTYEKGTSRKKTNKEELDNVVEPISVEQNNEKESNLSGELHESVVEQVSKDNTASEILEEKSEEIVAPVEEEFETESKDEELANEVEQQSNDESQNSVSGISAEELAAAMAEMPKKEEPQVKTTTSGGTVSAISAEELAAAMGDMPKAPDIIIEKSEPKHDEVVTPVTQEKVEQVVETPQTELVEDEPMTELVEDEPMTELVEDENEEDDEEYSSPTEKMSWADFFGELKDNSLTPAEKEEVNSRKKNLKEKKIAEEEKPIINQEIDAQQSVEVNEKPISSQESVASEQQSSVDNETISQEKIDDAAHKDLLNKLSSKPVEVKTTEGGGTVSGISAEELAAAMGIVYTPAKAPVVDSKIEENIEESEATYFEEEESANEEIIDEETESEVEPLHNESEDFDAQETKTVEGAESEDYIAEEIEEILNDGVEEESEEESADEESEEELVDGEEADFSEEPEEVFEDETTPIKKEITAEELEKQKRDEEQLAKLDEETRREYEMLVRKYSHNPIADKNKVDIIVKGDYDAEFDFEKRTDIKKISKAGKKKPFIIVAAILAVLLAVFLPVYFLVLNKEYEEPVVLTNVVFEAGANYYIYQDVGEYIDLSSAYMTATYSDGTTKKIQCDLSNLSYKDSWIEQTDEGLLIPDDTTEHATTLKFKYGQFENTMTIKIRHYALDSIKVIAYNIGNVVAGDKIAYSNFILSKVLKQTNWTTDPAPIQTREQIMKESDYNQITLSITKDGADFLTCTWGDVVADGGITFADAGEYELTFIYSGKTIAVNITVTA